MEIECSMSEMTLQVPALSLQNVSAHYPGSRDDVLHDCSFTMQSGEHVAVLGLNGSGKTTLLMAIAGLIPASGKISMDGVKLSSKTLQEVRGRMGFVFSTPEDQLLFPRVLDDVAYGLLRRRVPKEEALLEAQSALDDLDVGTLGSREPYELSHGQKLRVALAGALVTHPSLLLLDEATSALDPPGRRALSRLLRETSSAVLFATHDMESAAICCDRFILVEGGRIVHDTSSLESIRQRIDPPHFDGLDTHLI